MPTTAKKTAAKKTAPRKPPQDDDPYAPSTWGSSQIGGLTDLTCPSGQLCLVKRPGVEALLATGVLRDIDSLTMIVGTEHLDRVDPRKKPSDRQAKAEKPKTSEEIAQELLREPEKMANVIHTVDRVVCEVVVKPPINMTPNDPTNRKGGVIYADMVDLVDKMFIFNFAVGGSADLERFRQEFELNVGSLEPVEDPEGQAE